MGWNDHMDEPEVYGAQYARDAFTGFGRTLVDADRDGEDKSEACDV